MLRAWLVNSLPRTRRARIAADDTIVASFRQFQAAKPQICATFGKDPERLTFVDDADQVVQWLEEEAKRGMPSTAPARKPRRQRPRS